LPLQVFATDEDEGDNGLVLYEINRRQSDPDRSFVIDLKSGVITLNRPLDYELKRVHELVVQARDNASQPEVITSWLQCIQAQCVTLFLLFGRNYN